ncbi:hypothetical protein [Mycobacterium genavense]|uniref:hypothetical protein n=1 Tax=Mycobacterium genavense TaxID=36812 RepID=UPI00046EAEF6|nr:hypothetical protein [Mycobacterium genavense]
MTALADGGRLATITPDPPASTRGISVTAVYVRSDGAQLNRLTALRDSHRLRMPTPRSCNLDQAVHALTDVVAGHESNGVVITPKESRDDRVTAGIDAAPIPSREVDA